MKKKLSILFASSIIIASCTPAEMTELSAGPSHQEVAEGYAKLVLANYKDALVTAEHLKVAVDNFVANPSLGHLENAKKAWLEARIPYGQTEAFRFYAGPIDDANGPEGQLNAWPLDEAYIDYVTTGAGVVAEGIVQDSEFTINKDTLAAHNEGGAGDVFGVGVTVEGDKAISTGYHAVEFLLWGQDLDDDEPFSAGQRPLSDFESDPNAQRRKDYLVAATDLIVDDLQFLVDSWETDGSYRATFLSDADEAILKLTAGIAVLATSELAAERIQTGLDSGDDEDEHSCFADNTHVDILMNFLGVQNVYRGNYGSHQGPSLQDLVSVADPDLAATIDGELQAAYTAIRAMPAPFDRAIQNNTGDVTTVVLALQKLGNSLATTTQALGLGKVSTALPE